MRPPVISGRWGFPTKFLPSIDAISTPFLEAKDQTTLTIKADTYVKIINTGVHSIIGFDADTNVVIATALDTGAIAAGLDYCVYVCDDGAIKVSLNTTFPSGYTANNSRKIGGFHTLCSAAGTIAGHTLTTYATAAILPASVWCLNFRPRCEPAGMVYSNQAKCWGDIYLQSSTGVATASVHGAAITDNRPWNDHVGDLAAVGKKLMRDDQFQIFAEGSNLRTNIYGSLDPVTAGKCAPKLFTGAGLNDLTINRTGFNNAAGAQEYEFEIDATGTPDTVKWRQKNMDGAFGGYTAGVSCAAPITIDGAVFTFAASTGHTLGSKWNFYVMNGMRDTAGRRMVSNIGCEGMAGAMWQWLQDQSYQYNADVVPTYTTAAKTLAATHAAAPEGQLVYLKYSTSGIPYLCCNMATDAVDKILTFGAVFTVRIVHDANAAVGSYQVYFDEDAVQPARLLAALPGLKNEYLHTSSPETFLQVTYNAAPATPGVGIYFDDVTHERLEFISPTSTAAPVLDLAYIAGPTWGWYDLGTKGWIFKQGAYGDVKLLAGGAWTVGTYCGPRCLNAFNYRWNASPNLGGRGCAEPR